MFYGPCYRQVQTNLEARAFSDAFGRSMEESTQEGSGLVVRCLPFGTHLYPSPVKPALHVHVYEPTVLKQDAFLSQVWIPS